MIGPACLLVLEGSPLPPTPVLASRSLPLCVHLGSASAARRPHPYAVHPLYPGSRLPVLSYRACGEQITAADAWERGEKS